ncbi:carbohydrate sulfotransferase 9-like [Stegostoma tigrinum]|uniref:carbohydrate sulfotransferase 9-like n=1 Tax=Stegostoma tigrinum TaxID=3053191 RepID=UPI00202B2183|nr:carbohydrate sulfotransferase 9-like [Stegostoma tigrinum]
MSQCVKSMPRGRCCYKGSAKDMNLRHLFLSILSFGVAGLLLIIYFHVWIEEQPMVLRYKIQQDQTNKVRSGPTEIQGKNVDPGDDQAKGLSLGTAPGPGSRPMAEGPLRKQREVGSLLLKRFLQPLPLGPRGLRILVADEVHERRRVHVADFCRKYQVSKPRRSLIRLVSRLYVEDKHRLLYCEVPKAGCSNWKRVLMVLNGLASSPHNISHQFVHYGTHLRRLDSYSLRKAYELLGSFTKVLFVRDPMERLVSAFRDKFEHPNVYYHPVFGRAILRKYRANASAEALGTGAGVTFGEFVQYLLDPQKPVGMDIHWEPISQLCSPCLIDYDFIGKFEDLEKDANYFLKLIGAPLDLQFPSFKDRHSTDERTTPAVVKHYLLQIPPSQRQQIYNLYYLDYLMFNYSKPHF